MTKTRRRTVAAALTLLGVPAFVVPSAQADPLPDYCGPSVVVDGVCTVRLASVTADAVDGTITGSPVGGGQAITLAGPGDAYLRSAGFGDALPEPVRRWDDTIEEVNGLDVGPSDPNWYGNAKAKAFLPRTLNDLATQFPPDTLVVGFTPDDTQPGSFRLLSVQPTPG